ncbi:MAG TPA: hypothetical protein PKA28_04250 [Methylomusa anaerophila]|uniref:hypothetical protein n=1 Tax=Methylomusa anaerophila TaxID=1930071 RepID=UPI000F82E9FB|nr:hypothetical protein [Methylomusa anaerophila]HML87639.1 hypothetical protein [Methylomusa anaerophila]
MKTKNGAQICIGQRSSKKSAVNRHGGDATVVHLPEIGIHGNTHFPFSDLNNVEIADELSKFLKEKGLD